MPHLGVGVDHLDQWDFLDPSLEESQQLPAEISLEDDSDCEHQDQSDAEPEPAGNVSDDFFLERNVTFVEWIARDFLVELPLLVAEHLAPVLILGEIGGELGANEGGDRLGDLLVEEVEADHQDEDGENGGEQGGDPGKERLPEPAGLLLGQSVAPSGESLCPGVRFPRIFPTPPIVLQRERSGKTAGFVIRLPLGTLSTGQARSATRQGWEMPILAK